MLWLVNKVLQFLELEFIENVLSIMLVHINLQEQAIGNHELIYQLKEYYSKCLIININITKHTYECK